jgi:hypothetical protein
MKFCPEIVAENDYIHYPELIFVMKLKDSLFFTYF